MHYFISDCSTPLHYISSGLLVSKDGFVHPERQLDTFVLLLCTKGTICIKQDGKQYRIKPGQYMLLLPEVIHRGDEGSHGYLSYYWCHFKVRHNKYHLVNEDHINQMLYVIKQEDNTTNDSYIIPVTGMLKQSERGVLLFKALLDASGRDPHSIYLAHYALSFLAMEISADLVDEYDASNINATHKNVTEIKEWIKINCTENLNCKQVAMAFNYNPNYLSNAFKKHTGLSLATYINRAKIYMAKKFLLSSNDPIHAVAYASGFKDEKYFMRVFKQMESVTPSQYRQAFYRTHMNSK